MFKVYNHWDRLTSCVVGRSYPPEFYSFIENPKLRSLFERIAIETEEDYQSLIKLLKTFNVDIVRPNTPDIVPDKYINKKLRIPGPVSMNPRDQMIMIGEKFYIFPYEHAALKTSGRIQRSSLENTEEFNLTVKQFVNWWNPVIDKVKANGNSIIDYSEMNDKNLENLLTNIKVNGITRIGKDLYLGRNKKNLSMEQLLSNKYLIKKYFSGNYRTHYIQTEGHMDGCFTPVKPGLIISSYDMDSYSSTFPGWEVVKVKHVVDLMPDWVDYKKKTNGSWWIVNGDNSDELVEYVNTWLKDWVGNAEETVFSVNSLVIDEKNIIVSSYNKEVFDAYERHGVTPHIVNLRHRYFWDGGISCITAELNREGVITDWFLERGENEHL